MMAQSQSQSQSQAPLRAFDLALNRVVDDNIEVQLLDSPAGALDAPVTVPHPAKNPQASEWFEAARQPQVSTSELRKAGLLLFQTLFAGPIAARLRVTLRQFADPANPGSGLTGNPSGRRPTFAHPPPAALAVEAVGYNAGTGRPGEPSQTTSATASMSPRRNWPNSTVSPACARSSRPPASISALLQAMRSQSANALPVRPGHL
jgi:hypothetical protein